MDHVAIMKKSWGMIDKIISQEKTIESRWYKFKHSPWGKIEAGDMVYFKNSGEMISVRAEVGKVISFIDLTESRIKEIIEEYGERDGIAKGDEDKFIDLFKDKKYCLLVFIKKPEMVTPFMIDKKGFGAMAAWITVSDIESVKINRP